MSENFTQLADTLSSHEGKAFVTIDGSNRELFELAKINAQLDMIIQSKRMLGRKMTQHKPTGAEGTGSISMYFMNSQHLNRAVAYLNGTGKYKGITIQTYNQDDTSTVGKQEVVLTNVFLKTIPVAMLDDSSDDPIIIDSDITFDDIQVLSSFTLPENYR